MKNKDRKFLGFSLIFGFLSAACCILPLLAVLFGVSFLSVLAIKLEKLRWVFIGISILFIGATGYWLYQEKRKCNCLSKKKLIIFAIAAAIVLLFIPDGVKPSPSGLGYKPPLKFLERSVVQGNTLVDGYEFLNTFG